jgi:thioesterase domain-containing protein
MTRREPPANQLDVLLVDIWSRVLARPIGIDDSLADLGVGESQRKQLLAQVEAHLGRSVPDHEWDPPGTIAALSAVMARLGVPAERGAPSAESPRPRVFTRHPDGHLPPLFFLHGDLNGGGYYCLNLAAELGASQPLYALGPHGLHGVPIPTTIERMAEDQLVTLRAIQPRGPYRLAGHCNGGLVAFEMARLLEAQGERVAVVVLIATDVRSRAAAPSPEPARSWSSLLRYYWQRLRRGRNGMSPSARASDSRGARALAERRRAHVERLGAYARVLATYSPGSFGGPVVLLWPKEDRMRHPGDPTQGWGGVAPNLTVRDVPGGHLSCVTTHVGAVAVALRRALESA